MTPGEVLSLALINEYTDTEGQASLIDAAMDLAEQGYTVVDRSEDHELLIEVAA